MRRNLLSGACFTATRFLARPSRRRNYDLIFLLPTTNFGHNSLQLAGQNARSIRAFADFDFVGASGVFFSLWAAAALLLCAVFATWALETSGAWLFTYFYTYNYVNAALAHVLTYITALFTPAAICLASGAGLLDFFTGGQFATTAAPVMLAAGWLLITLSARCAVWGLWAAVPISLYTCYPTCGARRPRQPLARQQSGARRYVPRLPTHTAVPHFPLLHNLYLLTQRLAPLAGDGCHSNSAAAVLSGEHIWAASPLTTLVVPRGLATLGVTASSNGSN